MSVISGTAKKYDGSAIDYVLLFNWITGACIAKVTPNALGEWLYTYPTSKKIGITYVADGCEPVTHGAYEFIYTAYWWRITNIDGRIDKNNISVAEIRFNNEQGAISDNPTKGFANSFLSASYVSANAFDGNPATFAHCASLSNNNGAFGKNWVIGYQFDTEVNVTSVSVQMRQDMQSDFGQEWQTADVEVSADGITWVKYGKIEPMIAANDISVVTSIIIRD